MKKLLFLSVALIWCAMTVMAVPAHPGILKVQQPDGSFLTLRLVGDEWRHFNTTADGYSVVKDSRGYYVYAQRQGGRLMPTARVAHDATERTADEQAFLAGQQKFMAPDMTAAMAQVKSRVETIGAKRRAQGRRATDYQNFKGLIVLVEFNDKSFSRPDYTDIITDMVNKENYAGFDTQKMTGSVRDYFSDNSNGKFKPQFDIVGPYKVNFSQYDCNMEDGKVNEVVLAAIDSADVDVDFKKYDGDGDNLVDLVFFVIAGNGANYTGNDKNLWWPHRSIIYNPGSRDYRVVKDGVTLWDYASSTELAGYVDQPRTIMIDGIGTICHEFSHVLGLPDFYDANYEEDGQSITPGVWSLMDQGCYLNGGYTPCGYSLYERWAVGFIGDPQKIEGEGSYELAPLHSSRTGYRIDTPETDEFFLLENRQNGQFKWDAYLPASGMLVHRVDLSSQRIWQSNAVNNNSERNYYELVRACGNTNNAANDVFPGRSKVTSLHNGTEPANMKTWSGKATQWGLFDITMGTNGKVTFDVHDARTLKALSLPETAEVGVSVSLQLSAVLTPDYAVAALEWSSSNTDVATVDANGLVTGVSEGICDITVRSDNGQQATCKLTVKAVPLYNIADFKALETGSEELLWLQNAQVLFASDRTAFVRDASGALMLVGVDALKTNDMLNGAVQMQVSTKDGLPQATVTANTIVDGLTITDGSEFEPRETKLETLSSADFCDIVKVKAAKLVAKTVNGKSGVYLESGDRSIRFFNNLKNLGFSKSVTMPRNYIDKYYDVTALYATYVDGSATTDALYLMDSLVEVDGPTGIVEVRKGSADDGQAVYNLQGQRVSPKTKGLIIKNGKKVVNL